MSMMDEGAPPDAADAPPDAAGAKQSQQEANYREGNPQRSCGLCGHFDSKGHSCDVVEGDISPFGFSDRYLRQDNPFRSGEKDSFKGGTKVTVIPPMATLPGETGLPLRGMLQIGRKSYGGALILGFVLLAANIVTAHAEDRKCIREMYLTFGDMKYAKRLCDPKNWVTDPNEYGWMCLVDKGHERVKGAGTKQQKDAPCE